MHYTISFIIPVLYSRILTIIFHFFWMCLLGLRPWQYDVLKKMYSEANLRKTRQRLNQLVDDDVWPNDLKGTVLLCSFLYSMCLDVHV